MISVCIPTYNGAKYIFEQLKSILPQIGEKDEIIISDDGSTDDTVSIIESIRDNRIRVLHHQKKSQKFNFGYTAQNLEHALRYARGNYIFLADQDDIWLPNKVTEFLSLLETSDIILSDCKIVDQDLNVVANSKFKLEHISISPLRNIVKNGYLGCCMAFRSNLLNYILPFPKNVPHDLWIGIIGYRFGKFNLLPIPTLLYRRHEGNVTSTNKKLHNEYRTLPKNKNSLLFKINYRMNLLYQIMKHLC